MATRAELFEALKTKAGHGDPEAMLELAVTLGRSDPGSHVWIQRAAEAGLPRAHASLGWAYEKGFHGLEVDLGKAVDCYTRAVAAGVTELGPLALPKHLKALKKKAAAAGTGGDPIQALIEEAKLGKQKKAILASVRPSIRWIAAAPAADLPVGASKLGGSPDLPAGAGWPTSASGRPLEHVASLDFDAAPRLDGVPGVAGRLAFFYDTREMPWGGPGETGWAVLHIASGAHTSRVPTPPGASTIAATALAPVVEKTLPSARTRAFRELGLTAKAAESYLAMRDRWPAAKGDRHRSFGHEDAIQGDMPRRLVYGEAGADIEQPVPELEARAAELVLLFQMDSYEYGRLSWGDAGRIFFWITRADLAAGRFDRVRFQMQD